MPVGKHGEQPAKRAMHKKGISAARLAVMLGVSHRHVENVLSGKTRPMPVIRKELPAILGLPLAKLFTPGMLEKPYDTRHVDWRPENVHCGTCGQVVPR